MRIIAVKTTNNGKNGVDNQGCKGFDYRDESKVEIFMNQSHAASILIYLNSIN